MIEYLKGELTSVSATRAVVECCGVGYALEISLTTYDRVRDLAVDSSASSGAGETMLWVHEVIREDEHLLYGFATEVEREMFRLLIGVSGVGPNTARLMLSTLTVVELASAIAAEDVKTVKHVKGVGVKTAERVIVELKDKMGAFVSGGVVRERQDAAAAASASKGEALTALTMLGFAKAAAEKALDGLNGNMTTEELIKAALEKL